MTYKEKVEREKENSNKIVLYPEGSLFLNAFERSAYAFCYCIKAFKVNVKMLKSLEEPCVNVGFPTSKLDEYFKGYKIEKGDDCYIIPLDEEIDEADFKLWKASIIEEYIQNQKGSEEDEKIQTKNTEFIQKEMNGEMQVIQKCIKDIKELNMAMMTPMEAMNFLSNIQGRLKNIPT